MRVGLRAFGVVATLGIVIAISRSWAEIEEKKMEVAGPRICLINLTYVIKNYDKQKKYQEEIKEMTVGFQKREVELRARLKDLRDKAKNPLLVPAKGGKDATRVSQELEAEAMKIQKELEENRKQAKEQIEARRDQQTRIIYLDLTQAAQRYAVAHNLDLLLHYNDAITKEDYISTKNIARKMDENALMPLYWKRSMDISMDLVAILNRKLRDD